MSSGSNWSKANLKGLRHKISACKTTEDFIKAIDLKDGAQDQKNGEWKSTLIELGNVMKGKWNWDWEVETEKVIQEAVRRQRIRRRFARF